MQYIVPLKIACALLILMLVSAALQNRFVGAEQNRIGAGADTDAQPNSKNDVPIVSTPFKNLFDDQGTPLNVILIAAPFRTEEDEQAYEKYRRQGLSFCGISSYINFPGHIENPHEDRFHEERGHDYPAMVSAWLHCFRDPPTNLRKSGLPLMLLAESDLKDADAYKPDPSIKKEYDFMYVCLQDNDKCEPGWQSYNRNWDLAKQCLEIMCGEFGLRGVLVGRTNCEFTKKCNGIVKVVPFLAFDEFQREMQKCRFLFVPNIADASPRVITEAICYDMPVLVNRNILGGWHYVEPGITGEFFTSARDIVPALRKLTTTHRNAYAPCRHFMRHHGKHRAGRRLAAFLKQHYPDLNNRRMKYATITI
uniref:Glycosyltransferase n=1 Tax=viral metagenome TaxID=1070528 RepID=A0A6C0I522_9ZZZZ